MLNAIFAGAPALLRAGGASSPGFIVGPIAKLMGIVYDWLFNFIYSLVHIHIYTSKNIYIVY